MKLQPQSLFARTALLIGGTIVIFSILAWQAIIWTTIEPAAAFVAPLLTQRAHAAIDARRAGQPPPEGTRFEAVMPTPMEPRFGGFAFRAYVDAVRAQLQTNLQAHDVRIHRLADPSEIWLRTPAVPDAWLVLTWRIAGPKAPYAAIGVLGAAAVLVLGAAAWSARRLTAPLAALAAAAERLTDGERVDVETGSGPTEVRSLATAFQTMTQRLAEHEQQRELMLGGISHDLRTPLARLRVAVELLESADPALTAEITANIGEMDRMVGGFLQYVRANYREIPTAAALDDITRQTLAIFATDPRLVLDLDAPETRRIATHATRHALLNLVQNAMDHGEPPVTVRTTSTAALLRLQVHDCGTGLSAAEWAAALRPFHRLREQSGSAHTGLGLAMTERLARICGGHLEAAQSADGFTVTLAFPAQAVPPVGSA